MQPSFERYPFYSSPKYSRNNGIKTVEKRSGLRCPALLIQVHLLASTGSRYSHFQQGSIVKYHIRGNVFFICNRRYCRLGVTSPAANELMPLKPRLFRQVFSFLAEYSHLQIANLKIHQHHSLYVIFAGGMYYSVIY